MEDYEVFVTFMYLHKSFITTDMLINALVNELQNICIFGIPFMFIC